MYNRSADVLSSSLTDDINDGHLLLALANSNTHVYHLGCITVCTGMHHCWFIFSDHGYQPLGSFLLVIILSLVLSFYTKLTNNLSTETGMVSNFLIIRYIAISLVNRFQVIFI